jgi:hypothetical protein
MIIIVDFIQKIVLISIASSPETLSNFYVSQYILLVVIGETQRETLGKYFLIRKLVIARKNLHAANECYITDVYSLKSRYKKSFINWIYESNESLMNGFSFY